MSVDTPAASFSEQIYGLGYGRGDLEVQVLQTIRDWIVAYIADYERQHGLVPRSTPIPPTPESILGGIDFSRWSGELLPQIIAVVQPIGTVERWDGGTYGSWYTVTVGAIVSVEGDPGSSRALADAYGSALQKMLPEQGAFGTHPDGSPFAVRTRLEAAYSVAYPDDQVRDIVRASVTARTFLEEIVTDSDGPRVPPDDPYAVPLPLPEADLVEVNLIHGTLDQTGVLPADAVILDATVYPPVTRLAEVTVDVPSDD